MTHAMFTAEFITVARGVRRSAPRMTRAILEASVLMPNLHASRGKRCTACLFILVADTGHSLSMPTPDSGVL